MSAAYARLWTNQFLEANRIVGTNGDVIYVMKEGVVAAYISEPLIKAYGEFAEKNYYAPEFQKDVLKKGKTLRDEFDALLKKTRQEDVRKQSNEILAGYLEEYERVFVPITGCFNYSRPEFTQGPFEHLKKELAKKGMMEEAAALLLQPNLLDVLKREELALMQLALEEKIQELDRHVEEFGLLFYNSYDEKTNAEYLKSRIREFQKEGKERIRKRMREIMEGAEEISRKQERIAERIGDQRLENLAFFLRDLGIERFELKNAWAGAETGFRKLFEEVARRMGVSLQELMGAYDLYDMRQALRTGKTPSLQEMRKRKAFYAYHNFEGELKCVEGEAAKTVVKSVLPHFFDLEEVAEVKGVVASKGKTEGRAFVVLNAGIKELLEDAAKCREGNILVTAMTQPSMVVLARKAAAIVTDEGGITSHAAVISREFGVPCVVGTHKATKVLQTGDWVEVNAEGSQGVVRKLGGGSGRPSN